MTASVSASSREAAWNRWSCRASTPPTPRAIEQLGSAPAVAAASSKSSRSWFDETWMSIDGL